MGPSIKIRGKSRGHRRNEKNGTSYKVPAYIKISGKRYYISAIGAKAFSGCRKAKRISLPGKLETIGNRAFYKCTALTKVTIPAKVGKIGKSAFRGCKKLKTITLKTTKLTEKNVGAGAFSGTPSDAAVKVPKKSLAAYSKWLTGKGISKKATIRK